MKMMKRVSMFTLVAMVIAGIARAQIRTPRIDVEIPRMTIDPMIIEPLTIEPMVVTIPPIALEEADMALAGAELSSLSDLSGLSELAGLAELAPRAFRPRALAPAPHVNVPREAWAQGDPADSLYRAAREALNRSNYRSASTLFAQIRQRYPQSKYVADAMYWDAYAQWKQGGEDRLRMALELLAQQRKQYPAAATAGGAVELETRIRGELARHGDSQEAERIAEIAGGAVTPQADPPEAPEAVVAPGVAVRARPAATPRVAITPRPPRAPRAPRLAGESDELPENCSRDDYEEKVAALNALLQMNSDRGLPILKQLLARRDECSTPLRRKAVFLVAQQKSSESADILVNTVKTDPDPEVKRQGVFWLGQVEGDRSVELLGDILRTSDDVEMQKRALFALSQHEGSKAAEMVRSYAEREDIPEELQKQAIFYIGQHETAEDASFLRALYGRLKSREAKERILFSVSQMRGEGSGRWLLEIASNSKEPVELRKKALFWAGQQNGADVATFTGLYEKMPDREMKEQLIFLYSQRREPAAVDKLLEIAQKEPDRDLRKKAIFWLTQSTDPRVVKFLEDIINR